VSALSAVILCRKCCIDCSFSVDVGAKSALKVKVQDGPELYVCRLTEGRTDFANLDLVLDEYTEFTVEGAALHITGTLLAQYT